MKEWHDKGDLVKRCADARRDARDTGPRMSNDELEAAMFIAMAFALSDFFKDQTDSGPPPVPDEVPPEPEQPPEPQQPVTVLPENDDTSGQQEQADEQRPRPSRRRPRAADDGGEGDQSE